MQSFQKIALQGIETFIPIGTDLRIEASDGTFQKIRLPFTNDCLFHFIDDNENETGTAPISTFNELIEFKLAKKTEIDTDVKVLTSSFNKQLLSDKDKQRSIILNYFIDSLNLYKQASSFYAPYVTICQSSGVGKSKFVLECGEVIPLIYGVFRAETDRSYPFESSWIKSFVEFVLASRKFPDPKETKFESSEAQLFSIGRVFIYINAILGAYKTLYDEIRSKGKSASEAFKEINWMFHTTEGNDKFAQFIKIDLKATFEQVFRSICKITEYLRSGLSTEFEESPVVIVFDDFSLLLEMEFPNNINLFQTIRHALHLLPQDRLNLLFVGIGASGDASTFQKEINDSSLRFISRNLFLPSLILGSNWDIFKKFIDLNGFKLSLNNVRNSKMIKLICSFGRALWSSLPLRSVITVAKKKLTNGSSANFYPAMAFWSMRTGLSLNSDLMLSRTLVRSYMAIVFSTSYDAQLMNVGYPSEPILAIASRDLLDFETLLYALLEFVQLHPIDKA